MKSEYELKYMEVISEFRELSKFIKERAAENHKLAEEAKIDCTKSHLDAYANAYELCAKWIDVRIKKLDN